MKLLTIIFFFLSPWLYAGPKVVTLKTRPKVSLSFLLDQPAQLRKGTLLLFVGGEGDGAFKYKNGKVALGQNFLARILPYLVEHGYAAVLLGIPSDLPSGYTDKFRTSTEHLNDIAMVVEYLKKRDLTPIHLVGTSRGALSATFAASALEPLYVKSLVLTGAVTGPLEGPLPARVQQGTLIVHHLEDPCPTAPYNEAAGLRKNFTSSPRVNFIGVAGGLDPAPKARPCSAKTQHGFLGKEEIVARAILEWIEGQTPPPKL